MRKIAARLLFAKWPFLVACACSSSVDHSGPLSGGEAGAGGGAEPADMKPAGGAAGGGAGGERHNDASGGTGPAAGGTGGATTEPGTGGGGTGGDTPTGGDGGVGGEPPCPTWYRDADGDGFGDAGEAVTACVPPAGYVANSEDCYDSNHQARPGQEGRFSVDRGDGSFDYDCDGESVPLHPRYAYCPDFEEHKDHACPPANLWPPGYAVAACLESTDHPQCYCDYYGMAARFEEAREGWLPILHYEQCPEGSCPVMQTLPPCGTSGYWGAQITWDASTEQWKCSDSGSTGKPKRGQVCR